MRAIDILRVWECPGHQDGRWHGLGMSASQVLETAEQNERVGAVPPEAPHDLSLGSGAPQMESGLIVEEDGISTTSVIAQLECGVDHGLTVEDCRLNSHTL